MFTVEFNNARITEVSQFYMSRVYLIAKLSFCDDAEGLLN